MHDAYKTREVGRYTVSVVYDDDPMSPRDWDNVGKLYGDGSWEFEDGPRCENVGDAYHAARRDAGEPILALRCRIHDYGSNGLRMDEWPGRSWDDSNAIYWAPLSKAQEWGEDGTLGHLRDCLRVELATLNQYLEGDVWGYVISTPDNNHVDSCWGFFGTDDAMSEGVAAAEWMIAQDIDAWCSVPEWMREYVLAREEVSA